MQAVLNTVNPIQTAIRSIFVTLDMGIYDLLKFMYELFFHIATNNLIDREMIFNIFSRVQLVIGIFMMFQLVMIVIKGIVNPDSFTDSKSGGAGSMVMRIIVALALLAVIVPINIPSPRNEYEKQINNNGLLFGTLYSLQYRVLANNTLGRIILDDKDVDYTDGGTGVQDLSLFANRFTTAVVKVFYTLNTDENGDYVCNDGFDKTYASVGTTNEAVISNIIGPTKIIINGDKACGSGIGFIDTAYTVLDPAQVLKIGQQYKLTINWLSTVVGIVLVALFFMMSFNVAKRVFKLAALQLIAPIPIISYMDPKGSKDGAFNSWVKMLATTYLELFIQLAVVYFSFAIINSFITKFFDTSDGITTVANTMGGDFYHGSGLICWTFIIMTIALFIFAKDAPKFFKQALGIKDNGQGFFSAFGAAMGLGTAAVGAIGSARAGFKSSRMADETRQSLGITDRNGNVINPNSGFNRAKHALAGIFGGAKGLSTGASAALNAKDHNAKAAWDAMQKQNAAALARGNDGSTLLGRLGSTASGLFMGEGAAGAIDREINTNKARMDALKAIKSRVSGEMVKSNYTVGKLGVIGSDGKSARANYKDFMARYEAAKSQGLSSFKYKNLTTNTEEVIDMQTAESQKGFLLKTNEDNYIKRMLGTYSPTTAEINDGDSANNYTIKTAEGEKHDDRFGTLVHNAEILGGSSNFTRNADGTIKKGDNKHITDRDSINDAIDAFEDYNTQLNRQNALNRANDQYSGNKK